MTCGGGGGRMPLSKEPDGGQLTSSEELQRSESMGSVSPLSPEKSVLCERRKHSAGERP